MSHHRKKSRKMRGGSWIPDWLNPWAPKPTVQTQVDQTMEKVVKPLGATQENTGVPGGMGTDAPASAVLGGRRRKTRRHKSRH
jgi:hypothetical protein